MRLLKILVAMALLTTALFAHANDSFRLANGKLIQDGQSKQEVLYIAGDPVNQEVETIAVDDGAGGNPVKREILTYRLRSSLGGMSLVVVTIENNTVVAIESRQESRL
ncbi:hypothetical protein EZI54_19770 [Marinobacter halodurans]|uniref:DUF2845 domain-containing protein n=1 Tax=Marinobacter halodurans TaxID=2528979 RepID=A0ABY1ZF65_9GAMM|nr:hypothetical protein [Marinobacter halodurans]TBW49367.1 hypothetical protein EZI54_19770 [Marinobacter halodurans]